MGSNTTRQKERAVNRQFLNLPVPCLPTRPEAEQRCRVGISMPKHTSKGLHRTFCLSAIKDSSTGAVQFELFGQDFADEATNRFTGTLYVQFQTGRFVQPLPQF